MKIAPTAALTRLASRFNERRARAALGERPPMTEADEENITAFAHVIDELINLLERENEALRQGDLEEVVHLFEGKQEMLRRLETRQPVIEPFLRESAEITEALRLRIRSLAAQLETNGTLLASMAEASQTIRAEVNRVRDRHSLKGMYNKTGQARESGTMRSRKLDANL